MPTVETHGRWTCFTYSKDEWKTFNSPETVFNILDYTFELPPPGPPPLKDGQGMSFRNSDPKPVPLDMAEHGKHTRSGIIAARQAALDAYDGLKDEMVAEITRDQKTRDDLAEKLAELPDDEENAALRNLLTSYVTRLDRSLARTQSRLDELEKNYGPQGTYRKDIADGISEWISSGTIYSEKLIENVHKAKTVDEMLEQVGKLFLDLKRRLAELKPDADWRQRNETRDYAIHVQLCLDGVKSRLKHEFGWEGGDLDLSPSWFAGKTDGFDLAKELGYTDPMDIQDAFLAAIAGSDETWPSGASRNPIDIVDHFLKRIESTIGAARARLKPLPDDLNFIQTESQEFGWIPIRQPAVPQGKVSNPALVNLLAGIEEAAEAAE
jgi:hypothetical protein